MSKLPKDPIQASGGSLSVATSSIQFVHRVRSNVRQTVLIITRDKIELCLGKHLKRMERRFLWIAPASLGITIITVLLTSTFKDALFSATNWHQIFVALFLACVAWFCIAIAQSCKAVTMEKVIEEMFSENLAEEDVATASVTVEDSAASASTPPKQRE